MIKSKKAWVWITAGLVVIQIILSHFIHNPPTAMAYAWLTFSSVALCFLYVLAAYEQTPLKTCMLVAFSATVCADFFLTEITSFEGQKVVAMSFFCVTQFAYFIRLYRNHLDERTNRLHVMVRASVCAVALLAGALVLKEANNALSVISVFYFANLAVNLFFAFAQWKRSPFVALGLLFFLACDVFVGLGEMAADFLSVAEGSLIDRLTSTGVNIAWIFYVPSQTLLAVSVHDEGK